MPESGGADTGPRAGEPHHPGPGADSRAMVDPIAGGLDGRPDAAELGLLRDVMGMLSEPTLVLDEAGHVVMDNVAARDLLGMGRLEGRRLHDLVSAPDVVDRLLRRWRTTTARRPGVITTVNGERLRCDGGRLRGRSLLLVHVRPQHRALQAFSHVNVQVDAANLRQLSDRLQKTIAELSAANRRLAAANDELGQYASAVSHDLRTPLFAIKGNLELLIKEELVTDEGMALAEATVRATRRLERTTSALLSVARLEPDERPSEPVDTGGVLDHVLEALQADLDAADADLVVDSLPPVLVAEAPLGQVLQNLLANSLANRFPDRRPRIEISARRLDSMVEISVRDNGTGIDVGDHERIFELFRRGNAGHAGSGIGLTTCRKLVNRWGGDIRSVPVDMGAMFTFTAPSPHAQRVPSRGTDDVSQRKGDHHVRL